MVCHFLNTLRNIKQKYSELCYPEQLLDTRVTARLALE